MFFNYLFLFCYNNTVLAASVSSAEEFKNLLNWLHKLGLLGAPDVDWLASEASHASQNAWNLMSLLENYVEKSFVVEFKFHNEEWNMMLDAFSQELPELEHDWLVLKRWLELERQEEFLMSHENKNRMNKQRKQFEMALEGLNEKKKQLSGEHPWLLKV